MSADRTSVRPIRGADDFAAAFDVSRETIARLETYEALLRQWQKAVNLVAPGTLDTIWHRHFADSAQLVPLAPPGLKSWIDLGSGAGFPGLVVAILLAGAPSPRLRGEGQGLPSAKAKAEGEAQPQSPGRPVGVPSPLAGEGQGGGASSLSGGGDTPTLNPSPRSVEDAPSARWGGGSRTAEPIRITLIESDTRKCAFLREVVRQTAISPGISVDILSTRAESVTIQVNLALPRVVSARALAPLDKLLALAAPLSPPSAVGLYMKGKEAAKELQAAEKSWKFNAELVPSVTDKNGRIIVIRQLERKAKD